LPTSGLAESSRLIDKLDVRRMHFLASTIMSNDSNARANPSPQVASEDDYRSFCAALSESARGRDFLAEYARRNRNADTEMLLLALGRLEAQVRSHIGAPEADRIRQELRALLAAIGTTRPEIDESPSAIRAAKLAALLGFVVHRIEVIVAPTREQSILPDEVAALVMPERAAEAARSALAVVPAPDEPELPIPSPTAAQPPAPISLVRNAPAIPEVAFAEGARAEPAAAEPAVVKPATVEPSAVKTVPPAPISLPVPVATEIDVPVPKAATALPPIDPLASIMALSEAERIALFT
jgi:hypothetical protein